MPAEPVDRRALGPYSDRDSRVMVWPRPWGEGYSLYGDRGDASHNAALLEAEMAGRRYLGCLPGLPPSWLLPGEVLP